MAKLEEGTQNKVKDYLISKGKEVEDLNEGQLTKLYWEVLSEEEKTTVTSYDLTDDNDSSKFNDELDKVDPEKIVVGDGSATIEEEEITEVEKTNVMKFDLKSGQDVQVLQKMLDKGIDSEKLTIGTDGTITLSEEDIRRVMIDNQNPIMSKSDLIQEMRRQIVNEDNKYENELNSGDNEYSKHLDPDAVRDMGRRLYNDIRDAAEQKLGGANFERASIEMSRSLMSILQYELDKKPQLQEEAIRLIRDKYPAMSDDVVDIEAIITGHPDLGGQSVDKGDMRYEKGDTPPPTGYSEDELKSEVTKRRLINAMAQGSARKSQNLHHLSDNSRVPREMKAQYGKLMAANDFIYWAMDREQIKQQGRDGVHAGNSKVQLNPETGKPKVIAQGMTFSILLHELDKGIKELIALHGTHEDMELNKYVQDQVDHLDAEQDDIRLGVGIWEKVSQKIDVENPKHEALLFHKIVSLPSTEMNSLIRGLVSDNENSIDKLQEMSDEVSAELRQEEYDDAIGSYDEPTEQPRGEDDGDFADPEQEDNEYSDPLLRDLMGGGSQEEPSSEVDYSTMSKPDLQRAMDDALDSGDFVLAGKIGPHLH
jgi:hypothetical protein